MNALSARMGMSGRRIDDRHLTSEQVSASNRAFTILKKHVALGVLHGLVNHRTHRVIPLVAQRGETQREISRRAILRFIFDRAKDHGFRVSLLDLLLVDLDGGVVGQAELIEPEGVRAVPIIQCPDVLDDVFAGLEEPQSHLNLEHQVIDGVEDSDAGSHAGVPVLPLDGQESLEIVKYDGCLVGEKTIGEECS